MLPFNFKMFFFNAFIIVVDFNFIQLRVKNIISCIVHLFLVLLNLSS